MSQCLAWTVQGSSRPGSWESFQLQMWTVMLARVWSWRYCGPISRMSWDLNWALVSLDTWLRDLLTECATGLGWKRLLLCYVLQSLKCSSLWCSLYSSHVANGIHWHQEFHCYLYRRHLGQLWFRVWAPEKLRLLVWQDVAPHTNFLCQQCAPWSVWSLHCWQKSLSFHLSGSCLTSSRNCSCHYWLLALLYWHLVLLSYFYFSYKFILIIGSYLLCFKLF